MAFFLEKNEPIAAGWRRVLDEQIDFCIQQLQISEVQLEIAIHETRKAIKRIRSLLRAARSGLGEKVYRRENAAFRDMARTLAPLRDATVLSEGWELLKSGTEIADRPFKSYLTRLLHRNREQALRSLEDPALIPDLLASFEKTRQRFAAVELKNFDVQELCSNILWIYRRGQKAYHCVLDKPCDKNFHEWRKQIKYHWHHVEICAQILAKESEFDCALLSKLSGLLGDNHDLAMLKEFLAAAPEKMPGMTDRSIKHLSPPSSYRREIRLRRIMFRSQAIAIGQEIYRKKYGRWFKSKRQIRSIQKESAK